MTISLPPELEAAVTRRVSDGSFPSETEVIREALRLLTSREAQHQTLLEQVAVGVADSKAGRVSDLSADDIKRLARERYAR